MREGCKGVGVLSAGDDKWEGLFLHGVGGFQWGCGWGGPVGGDDDSGKKKVESNSSPEPSDLSGSPVGPPI